MRLPADRDSRYGMSGNGHEMLPGGIDLSAAGGFPLCSRRLATSSQPLPCLAIHIVKIE